MSRAEGTGLQPAQQLLEDLMTFCAANGAPFREDAAARGLTHWQWTRLCAAESRLLEEEDSPDSSAALRTVLAYLQAQEDAADDRATVPCVEDLRAALCAGVEDALALGYRLGWAERALFLGASVLPVATGEDPA